MLLAAGRGERMRPLTDTCPKPLLNVLGRPLIVWHICNLVRSGITEIIINHAHLGHLIEDYLKDGSQWGAHIHYSKEHEALETAGGIANARDLLGDDPFVAIAADIYCPQFNFEHTKEVLKEADMWGKPYPKEQRDIAWLFLVKNPAHNPNGDFGLNLYSINNTGEPRYTFSGIGVYRPEMFDEIQKGSKAALAPLLRSYAEKGVIGGELISTPWTDVGTPERLEKLNSTPI